MNFDSDRISPLEAKVLALCRANSFISALEIDWILRNHNRLFYTMNEIDGAIKHLHEKKLIKVTAPGYPKRWGSWSHVEKEDYAPSEYGYDKEKEDAEPLTPVEIPCPPQTPVCRSVGIPADGDSLRSLPNLIDAHILINLNSSIVQN